MAQRSGVFHRAYHLLFHQVSVDGDRSRGPGAGRGDQLGARIDHVAGGPDTEGAGPAGGIDGDEAGLIDRTAQLAEQTVCVRQVAGPDEHRCPRDHPTVRQLDTGQPVGLDHQPSDLAGNDPDPACLQLGAFG